MISIWFIIVFSLSSSVSSYFSNTLNMEVLTRPARTSKAKTNTTPFIALTITIPSSLQSKYPPTNNPHCHQNLFKTLQELDKPFQITGIGTVQFSVSPESPTENNSMKVNHLDWESYCLKIGVILTFNSKDLVTKLWDFSAYGSILCRK